MKGFFSRCVDNYKVTIGTHKAIVLFFDAKGVTGNKCINLYDLEKGGFSNSLLLTSRDLHHKFKCKILVGTDEIKLIITEPQKLIDKYGTKAMDVVSIISQEMFKRFNSYYKRKGDIYFHGKLFAIPFNMVENYIEHEYVRQKNVLAEYFLSKNPQFHVGPNEKLNDRINRLSVLPEYSNLHTYLKGGLIIENGNYYDLKDYVEGIYTQCPLRTFLEGKYTGVSTTINSLELYIKELPDNEKLPDNEEIETPCVPIRRITPKLINKPDDLI